MPHDRDEQRRVDVAAREDGDRPARFRRRGPASSAATDAAPAPSTTSFVRSSRRTIAWLISSSVTDDDVVEDVVAGCDEVSSPGCFTAMPSAIVKPPTSPPASGANAAVCTPTRRAFGFTALIASAMPEASPPPPIGMITVSRSGTCSSELQTDRPLSGDHVLVLESVQERGVPVSAWSSAAASASSNVSPCSCVSAP